MAERVRVLRLAPSGSLTTLLAKYGGLKLDMLNDLGPGAEIMARFCPAGTFLGHVRLADHLVHYETPLSLPGTLRVLLGLLMLLRTIRRHSIQIVHSNSPYSLGLLGLVAARLTGRKFCVSVHSDYTLSEALQPGSIPRTLGSLTLTKWLERLLYRYADRVLPIRESMRPGLIESGCPPNRIVVFPHGMDLSAYDGPMTTDVRAHFGLPADCRLVSSVCRLEDVNYPVDLLTIAEGLAAARPDVCVLICGGGLRKEELRQRVVGLGLGGRILVTGPVPASLVPDIRRQSDAGLALMAGFSLIEACAAGRPVVSYDVAWHHELVRTGSTGALVREGDVQAVCSEVLHWLDDPTLAGRLGAAARDLAFSRHAAGRVEEIKLSIYLDMLRRPAAGNTHGGG